MGGQSKLLMLVSTPFPLLYPRASAFRLARYSSVSVGCLSSAAHRRRFFSDPRPHSCFPTKASEQIHTQTSSVREDYSGESSGFLSSYRVSHPWPEWSKLLENLRTGGFFDHQGSSPVALDGEFLLDENLPEDFVCAASACLSFARSRWDLLGSLSIKDIEVVIENGSPFLFKNALDSARRMKSFLRGRGNNGLEIERADMVDLMRFLLSYACSPFVAADRVNLSNKEMVESSVRNLFGQLADASITDQGLSFSGSMSNQSTDRYGQTPRPVGPNIEMKRGDWICLKCSFMNFARNMKCLECNESRPKRQLTGGEWDCPQCNFFNYGRNSVCLRCDCPRPGEATYGAMTPRSVLGYSNGSNINMANIESKLGDSNEKAERWFSKFSQLDKASDLNSAAADKDFPEIMPLRKGVNRFVVSTRKTPLERRLVNAQYRRNLGNDSTLDENDLQARDGVEVNQSKTRETSISQSLDRILGRSSVLSETGGNRSSVGEITGTERSSFSSSDSPQYGCSERNNSGYVPFVPLPADMFAKPQKSETGSEQVAGNHDLLAASTSNPSGPFSASAESGKPNDGLQLSEKPLHQTEGKDDKDQAEKSERWFKKVAELHNVTDLSSAISDEDFPEIMPMRKGGNRFVVSKKKDRSLTSPLYKRRMAMEQSSNTNFVPFVPFPPDYFAKKDKQPEKEPSAEKAVNETSISGTAESIPNVLEKSFAAGIVADRGASSTLVQRLENQHTSSESWNTTKAGNSFGENNSSAGYGVRAMASSAQRLENLQNSSSGEGWNSGSSRRESAESAGYSASTVGSFAPRPDNLQTNNGEGWNSGSSWKGNMGSPTMGSSTPKSDNLQTNSRERWNTGSSWKGSTGGAIGSSSQQPQNLQNGKESWNRGFSGESLEGSAVKEPDPLDMSQEAKEQRWFRRVAQIKDISELSNIPDEDFPEIMPMRKGVNRFVVSKRKTPLERRLTSPQYRRNLPIVSSEPVKKENDSS
ncbi:zinc finger protein VAR3, chloroplastic-like [Telopea speciosissima]|uniref:zinc finger protein VAR3, chloroplastic-like n=1 Tax=Telopea speciosissima TaxID=54955 RepID=UPI001CC78666|nr:zinc finger protein VAR3, chloroplastic-like [Telopea speciosissima]XP_043700757.1 zinc finger protein VAR3, chloroplastic-like [Telopea speciosissima]XP_043700758.1 zinc finger protein VAR3, chloroplastic-like [Telopea speciosissima]